MKGFAQQASSTGVQLTYDDLSPAFRAELNAWGCTRRDRGSR